MIQAQPSISKNQAATSTGQEHEFYQMLMQAPAAIVVLSGPENVIEFANDLYMAIAGKSREQLLNKPAFLGIPAAATQDFEELLAGVRQTGQPVTLTEHKTFVERAGILETAWLNIVYQPIRGGGRSVNKIMVMLTDVTETVRVRLKKEEEESLLRKTRDQLALSNSIGNIGIWHWDLPTNAVTWSKEQLAIYGLTEGEFGGSIQDFHRFVLPEDLPLITRTAAGERKSGSDYEYQFRIRRHDGEIRWIQGRSRSFYNEKGELEYRTGVNLDVTERKRAEEALRQSEEKFKSTFDNAAVGIAHVDVDGHWQMVNDRLCNIVGYTRDELLASAFQQITHPDDLEKDLNLLREILMRKRDSYAIEKRYLHKNGAVVWVNLTVSLVRNRKGHPKYFISIVEDISERKAAEEKAKESEGRFRTLADALPQMVWMRNADGGLEYASQHWQDYSGIEDTDEAWEAMVHPDDWEPVHSAWKRDSAPGSPFRFEVRLKSKSGDYRWHYSIADPLRDHAGNIVKWIGTLSDIHAQKTFSEKLEKEVDERTKELQRSNEDLQQFAHVASHDLKEPLRKVRTFGSRLEEECGALLPASGKLYLEKMQSSAERMSGLIDGVLNYSTLSSLESLVDTVDLNALFRSIEDDLELALLDKRAHINKENLPAVRGASVLLNQLFYNLLNNALKFSKPGVPPVVSVAAKPVYGRETNEVPEAEGGKAFLQISICDNGIGFRPEQAAKIFKTFTRLNSRDKYEGTGLGLALCKKIAERHGGYIYATGQQGEGACFYVLLPH